MTLSDVSSVGLTGKILYWPTKLYKFAYFLNLEKVVKIFDDNFSCECKKVVTDILAKLSFLLILIIQVKTHNLRHF